MELHVQEPWFSFISSGCKTVEVRVGSKDKAHKMYCGQRLTLKTDSMSCQVTISKVQWYPSLDSCLCGAGWSNAAPHATSLEDARIKYDSIVLPDGTPVFGSKRVADKDGVIAIHLVSDPWTLPSVKTMKGGGKGDDTTQEGLVGGGSQESPYSKGSVPTVENDNDFIVSSFLLFVHLGRATEEVQNIFAVMLKSYMEIPVMQRLDTRILPLIKQVIQRAIATGVPLNLGCLTTFPFLLKWYLDEYGGAEKYVDLLIPDPLSVEQLVLLLHQMNNTDPEIWDVVVTKMYESEFQIGRDTVQLVFDDDLLDLIGWGNRAEELRSMFSK